MKRSNLFHGFLLLFLAGILFSCAQERCDEVPDRETTVEELTGQLRAYNKNIGVIVPADDETRGTSGLTLTTRDKIKIAIADVKGGLRGAAVGGVAGAVVGAAVRSAQASPQVLQSWVHSAIIFSFRGGVRRSFLFFPGLHIFFPLFHGFGIVDGPQGGEGMEQAALEDVLLVIERAELLLGFRFGGLQTGGQFAAVLRQRLQLGVDDLTGFRLHGFQLLGEFAVDGVELGEAATQLDGAADGEDDVRQVDRQEDQGQGDGNAGGQEIRQPEGDGGIGEVAEEDAGQAEKSGIQKTDATVDMKFILGVVPPAHVEELLHQIAGHVLHGAGQHRACGKRHQGIGAAAQGRQHQQGPVAVDGAQRAVQKPPLLTQLPLPQGAVYHLPAPAEKAVGHQQ